MKRKNKGSAKDGAKKQVARKQNNPKFAKELMHAHETKTALKSIAYAALIALIPLFLAWFHISNPYFYELKIIKMGMYAQVMFVPAYLTALAGLVGIGIDAFGFYIVEYAFYFALFFVIIRHYRGLPENMKSGFLKKAAIANMVLVALIVFYLW